MYPDGLGMLDRVTGDLNQRHMNDIRTEVQAERMIPAAPFFRTVKHFTLSLYNRVFPASRIESAKQAAFIDGGCEGAPAPCA